jgi:hypothetical protein
MVTDEFPARVAVLETKGVSSPNSWQDVETEAVDVDHQVETIYLTYFTQACHEIVPVPISLSLPFPISIPHL